MTRYIVLGALNSLILLAISGSAGFDIVQRCGSLTPCAGPGWGTWLMAGLPLILLLVGAAIFAPRALRGLRARRAEAQAEAIAVTQSDAAAGDADDLGLSRLARLRGAPMAEVDMDVPVDTSPVDMWEADGESLNMGEAAQNWASADVDSQADDEGQADTHSWLSADAPSFATEAEEPAEQQDAPVAAVEDAPFAADCAAQGDDCESEVGGSYWPNADEIAPGFAALDDWQVEAPSHDLPAEKWADPGEDALAVAADAVPEAPLRADPFAAGRDRIVWAMEDDAAENDAATDAALPQYMLDAAPIADAMGAEAAADHDMTDNVDWSIPPAVGDAGEDDGEEYDGFDGADCPPIAAFAPADPWSAPVPAAPETNLSPLQQAAWLIAPGPLPRLRGHGETGFPWAAATISAVADSMLDLASPSSLGEFAAEVSAWKQVVAELPAATPIAGDDAAAFNAWLESLAQHLFLFGTPPDLETLLVDALSRLTLAAEGDGALAAMLPAALFPTDARNVA